MKKKIAIMLLLLVVLSASQAWAAPSCPLGNWAGEKAQSDSYPTKFMGQFVLGVDQILTSPIKLVWYTYDHIVTQKKYATGLFTGLGQGLVEAVESIGAGVVNIVTSPVPGYHGIKLDSVDTATTA